MWWYIMLYYIILRYIRRKFRSQTCDNMDRWKSKDGKSQRREEKKREDQRRERVRRKKMQVRARNGIKVAIRCVFPMMCGSGVSKSRLAKAAGAESSGQMGALLEVEMVKKVHAVVARRTFPSQNVQNTQFSDHSWKLRCWKSARHCGAKHIPKSKRAKHTILRPLLEVEISKKCTQLWREAHFQVKMRKTPQPRSTFGSWDVEKSARRSGAKHISKSKCTKHYMFAPLLEV